MDSEDRQDKGSTGGQLTRRRFLGTSGKFLVYTSPVLTTLLTADRALAVSVDPYFVVEARTAVSGTFAGMPAYGTSNAASTSTWTMQPALEDFAVVSYQQYFIGINGSGPYMPTQSISVKITWTRLSDGSFDLFRWGPGPVSGSNQTVTVPVGGGTLGIGGSIVDSVADPWPTVLVERTFSGTAGTVTFVPVGGAYGRLKQLTLNIVVQGGGQSEE
jgi:hypothetical protein